MVIQTAIYSYNPTMNERSGVNCVCDGQQMSVPLDPANRHYAEIMRQVADEGLVIAEPN